MDSSRINEPKPADLYDLLDKHGVARPYIPSDCPPGWLRIVDDLLTDLNVVSRRWRPAQIKEKFGGLRFYVDGTNDTQNRMIDAAEAMSYRTCEDCGGRGKPNRTGWIATLCGPCRRKRTVRRRKGA